MNLKITKAKLIISLISALIVFVLLALPRYCFDCSSKMALRIALSFQLPGLISLFIAIYGIWSLLQSKHKIFAYILGTIGIVILSILIFFAVGIVLQTKVL